jgi:signal transduction histidine kinase
MAWATGWPMRDERWGRRWGGGNRPPWWPEGESWPPSGPANWQRMRGRFLRRMGCLFGFVLLIGISVVLLVAWAVGTLLGANAGSATAIGVGLLVLIGLAVVARFVRRTAAPVGDLIEAAGRVESGDFGARVPERGPREVRALARAFNAMSSRLESTEAERQRLLADVSHELRTPLSVMRGNLEGLLDGVYSADREHLAPLLDEAHLMERLIEDLRTLSLAEAGALRLHREPTNLVALLGDVVAGVRAQADGQGVMVELQAADDLPVVDLDPARIRAVVTNLVVNALRYTPQGGRVTVVARPEHAAVSVEVADSGRGIEPDVLPRIFERFTRAADSPGSGLGLPIARKLVEAHGGEISATSVVGHGTQIRFTLPVDGDISDG